jgi:hypothetical protein
MFAILSSPETCKVFGRLFDHGAARVLLRWSFNVEHATNRRVPILLEQPRLESRFGHLARTYFVRAQERPE